MDLAAALAAGTAIVDAIVKIAPLVEKGVVSSIPYAQAIAGLISGSNATQEQVDDLLAQVNADSAEFQRPLPEDDGNTST